MFCTRCGHQNPDDARFCARCGTAVTGTVRTVDPSTSTTLLTGLGADEHEPDAGTAGEHGDSPTGEVARVLEALPAGTALLVVKRGPNAGSRFLLDKDVTTAGRHPESDIFLDDVTVSRRHAEFHRGAGGFTVRDVGSLNGTYLDRDRIEEARLSAGDEVQIGKFRLTFLAGPPLPGPAA